MVTHKRLTEDFETIAAGDRTETWDGIWGTITAVDFTWRPRWDGKLITLEATVTIESKHLPSFDSWGWPTSHPGTIVRTVRRHSSDLRQVYTPSED